MPCGFMYVYAASRRPTPRSVHPTTGAACVPLTVRMEEAPEGMATMEPSDGGAPVPLYQKYSVCVTSSKYHSPGASSSSNTFSMYRLLAESPPRASWYPPAANMKVPVPVALSKE